MNRTVLTVVLTTTFLLSTSLLIANENAIKFIESKFEQPFIKSFEVTTNLTNPLIDIASQFIISNTLVEENLLLRKEVNNLQVQLSSTREQLALKKLYPTNQQKILSDHVEVLSADVIARDIIPSRMTILVGKGSNDGVQVNQAVLGPEGLFIGLISDVSSTQSWIQLITDTRSSIPVIVQGARAYGSLEGAHNHLNLEFVDKDALISVDEFVVTSAMGGLIPGGLLIGKITSVDLIDQDMHPTIRVEPLSDLRKVERVEIITNKSNILPKQSERIVD
ncbi:MAG: rod shape-determining protein MreC [Dehalococcoidia bacterium]